MVEGIVDLAGSYGIPVIADGVTSKEQHDALRTLGCSYGQGGHYAPPMIFEDLVSWLKRTERAPLPTSSRSVGATRYSAWHPPIGPLSRA